MVSSDRDQALEDGAQDRPQPQVTTRFNPGKAAKTPYEIIYLGENPSVALFEVGALFGPPDRPVANPHETKFVPIDVSVSLQPIADLTDPAQQVMLDVSLQELTGNWDTYPAGEARHSVWAPPCSQPKTSKDSWRSRRRCPGAGHSSCFRRSFAWGVGLSSKIPSLVRLIGSVLDRRTGQTLDLVPC